MLAQIVEASDVLNRNRRETRDRKRSRNDLSKGNERMERVVIRCALFLACRRI